MLHVSSLLSLTRPLPLALVCVGDGWSLLPRPVRLPPTVHTALQVGVIHLHYLHTQIIYIVRLRLKGRARTINLL
jgi:hypothetical protein